MKSVIGDGLAASSLKGVLSNKLNGYDENGEPLVALIETLGKPSSCFAVGDVCGLI